MDAAESSASSSNPIPAPHSALLMKMSSVPRQQAGVVVFSCCLLIVWISLSLPPLTPMQHLPCLLSGMWFIHIVVCCPGMDCLGSCKLMASCPAPHYSFGVPTAGDAQISANHCPVNECRGQRQPQVQQFDAAHTKWMV